MSAFAAATVPPPVGAMLPSQSDSRRHGDLDMAQWGPLLAGREAGTAVGRRPPGALANGDLGSGWETLMDLWLLAELWGRQLAGLDAPRSTACETSSAPTQTSPAEQSHAGVSAEASAKTQPK